ERAVVDDRTACVIDEAVAVALGMECLSAGDLEQALVAEGFGAAEVCGVRVDLDGPLVDEGASVPEPALFGNVTAFESRRIADERSLHREHSEWTVEREVTHPTGDRRVLGCG